MQFTISQPTLTPLVSFISVVDSEYVCRNGNWRAYKKQKQCESRANSNDFYKIQYSMSFYKSLWDLRSQNWQLIWKCISLIRVNSCPYLFTATLNCKSVLDLMYKVTNTRTPAITISVRFSQGCESYTLGQK